MSGLQQLFNLTALSGSQRAMMCARNLLARKLVNGTGKALGDASCINEEDCGLMLANDLKKARVDALPDAGALGAL